MGRAFLLLLAIALAGCATGYKGPASGDTATLKIVLKEPLKYWTTVSFFEGLECSPSSHGEYGGDLHNGSFVQKPSEQLEFRLDAGKLISMELFETTARSGLGVTAEIVKPGQYCKNLLAFTPEKGAEYLIEYSPNCKYTLRNVATQEEIATQKPTGKCHSKNLSGAYE